jgi:DNA-directed RNA polymerase subunit M/transcription elongation factor TFIIS
MLIKFKRCPRCNGALFVDWDQHGQYVECLQCGYLRDLRSQPHGERQLAEEEEERALADYWGDETSGGSRSLPTVEG